MTKPAVKPAPANFEEALKELEAIVRKLEGGNQDLESSINDYMRGTELKSFCQQKLQDARMQVEKIMEVQNGTAITKEFEEK